MRAYAQSAGLAFFVPERYAMVGDVVAADWGGGRGSDFSPKHLMLITAVTPGGQIQIGSHGRDRFDFPLLQDPHGRSDGSVQGLEPEATFRVLHIL